MALYNVPLTVCRGLPKRVLEPLISVSVVGDFLVCSTWVILSLNDPYEAPWIIYMLVAIESAVLYRWSGGLSFMLAFTVVYTVLDWVRAEYFGPPFRIDSYVFHMGMVLLVAIFITGIGSQSHRRSHKAEAAAEKAASHAERSQALYVVASRIAATLKREYVLETVMDALASLFPDRWHGILLAQPGGQLELAHSRGTPEDVTFPASAQALQDVEEEALVISDLAAHHHSQALLPESLTAYLSAAALPLKAPGHSFGILVSLDREVGAFQGDEVTFLAALAHQTSTALENARLYEEVELMSLTDATTALFNRRAFDLRLEEELSRARRYQLPLALLMLDVDRFKLYNDEHGHLAGDRLLRQLGKILAANALRHSDLPFRFGGEEFAVIMPHTSASEALALARRVCAEVAEENIPHTHNAPYARLTVSIGVAAFPDDGSTGSDLVYHADVALYAAKRGGRNRVVVSNGTFIEREEKLNGVTGPLQGIQSC
jgi:diguanylate cyclase (GGDEF)-like protein